MADNRNQDRDQQQSNDRDLRSGQEGQRDNVSDSNTDQNPQQGSQWSNYQTRELANDQDSSEQSGDDVNPTVPRDTE